MQLLNLQVHHTALSPYWCDSIPAVKTFLRSQELIMSYLQLFAAICICFPLHRGSLVAFNRNIRGKHRWNVFEGQPLNSKRRKELTAFSFQLQKVTRRQYIAYSACIFLHLDHPVKTMLTAIELFILHVFTETEDCFPPISIY